jgi:hypothetical protein
LRRIWRHEQQLAQEKRQKAPFVLSRSLRLRSWFHVLKLHRLSGFAPAPVGT